MYFWKIDELRKRLIAGDLGERARFAYLILFVLLHVLVYLFPAENPDGWNLAISAVSIVGTILGTYWLYRINGGEKGSDFLERYLSLTFVYLLRFLVVALPLSIVAYGIAYAAGVVGDEPGPLDLIISGAIVVGYYVGVARHLRLVVAGAAAQQFAAGTTGPDGPAA